MTDEPDLSLGNCNCCDAEPAVGVAAVPGAPMSIAWGQKCLDNNATPLWVADFTISQCVNPDPTVEPTWEPVADWFREQTVYLDGEYVRVDTLPLEIRECEHGPDTEPHVDEHGSCPVCFRGKIVGIKGGV